MKACKLKLKEHTAVTPVMGAIFSGAECVVEKVRGSVHLVIFIFGQWVLKANAMRVSPSQARAKHDIYNSIAAGCVTGGAISASGGPQAACVGCVGFAAFSAVIDKFLSRDWGCASVPLLLRVKRNKRFSIAGDFRFIVMNDVRFEHLLLSPLLRRRCRM